jgi:hypothetical protein
MKRGRQSEIDGSNFRFFYKINLYPEKTHFYRVSVFARFAVFFQIGIIKIAIEIGKDRGQKIAVNWICSYLLYC